MHRVCIQTRLNHTYIRRCLNVNLHAYSTWGFLEMNDPQVAMGFDSIVKWSNDLDDLGYDSNRWAVAQPGDFTAHRAMPLAAVSALLLVPWRKTEVEKRADDLVLRWWYHVRSITSITSHLDRWVLPSCMHLYLSTLSVPSFFCNFHNMFYMFPCLPPTSSRLFHSDHVF